jgi:hypothetical protein
MKQSPNLIRQPPELYRAKYRRGRRKGKIMETAIYYALSEQGQKQAAKSGLSATNLQKIEADIKDDRLDFCKIKSDGKAELWVETNGNTEDMGAYNTYKTFDSIQTVDSIFSYLTEKKKKKLEMLEKAKEVLLSTKFSDLEDYDSDINGIIYARINIDGVKVRVNRNDFDFSKLNAERKELQAAEKAAQEEKNAAEKAAEEKRKAEFEAGRNALLEWAKENGSELLKARIEENFNWVNLARDEFFASIIPAEFEETDDKHVSCWGNASLEAIQELRSIRKQFENNPHFVSADLSIREWDLSEEDSEEDSEIETTGRYYTLEVEMISPDKFSKTFVKEIK